MKNIVLIEDADLPFSEGIRMAEQIRRENSSDFLTVIAEGDFRFDGRLAEYSAEERAGRWEEAGADLVLQLPVFSILGGYGKKDFAVAALMQRLHSVDCVILPCRPLPGQTAQECGAMLRKCAMLMFREHPDYRRRLQENLRRKMPFPKAQMDAVICCIPEAEELLRFPENRQSVRMLDAMLQLYYIVRVDFFAAGTGAVGNGKQEQTGNAADSRNCEQTDNVTDRVSRDSAADVADGEEQGRLLRFEYCAAENLKLVLRNQSRDFLMNISGSTEKAVNRILSLSGEIEAKKSFREIVELVEDAFANKDMARLFLLRVLLNIRHSDMLISGLYTYVPYCCVRKERTEKQKEIRQIEETSWVPFMRADDLKQGRRNGSEESPANEPGENRASEAEQSKAEQREAEQSKAGQREAEQGKVEQREAEQGKAEQGKAEQREAEQSKVEQREAEQGKAEQREAEQSKAEQREKSDQEQRQGTDSGPDPKIGPVQNQGFSSGPEGQTDETLRILLNIEQKAKLCRAGTLSGWN